METRKLGHVTLEDAKGAPVVVTLPFDVTEGQHSYDVKVTGSTATFTADGVVIGTFSSKDMPGGIWTSGAMKSFVNLWCVDPSLEGWAGKWTYPGDHKLVGKVSAVTYQPLGGEPHLIGGPGAGGGVTDPSQVSFERQGGSGVDALDDIAGASTDFQGGTGNDTFRFVKGLGPRGGAAETDVIWDFNPHTDALAENDTVQVSKGLVGVNGFAGLYRAIVDVDGEAVLKFADGSTVTFHGLHKADLGYDDFVLV
jgi:serralysin